MRALFERGVRCLTNSRSHGTPRPTGASSAAPSSCAALSASASRSAWPRAGATTSPRPTWRRAPACTASTGSSKKGKKYPGRRGRSSKASGHRPGPRALGPQRVVEVTVHRTLPSYLRVNTSNLIVPLLTSPALHFSDHFVSRFDTRHHIGWCNHRAESLYASNFGENSIDVTIAPTLTV